VDGVQPAAAAPSLCPWCSLWRELSKRRDFRIPFVLLRDLCVSVVKILPFIRMSRLKGRSAAAAGVGERYLH